MEYDPDDPGGAAQGTPCGADIDIHYDPANCGPGRDESDSGKAVLDYQLTDDVMLYASYKRGFKSGGFSAALDHDGRTARDPATFGAHVLNTTVDEEILQAYEGGIKSMWWRLRFNLSAFFYDYDDLQVFTLGVIGGTIQTLLENASDATIWGGEADMFACPLPGLEIRLAATVLNTEYKDYGSAEQASDFSGNEMIAAPNYSASGLWRARHDSNVWPPGPQPWHSIQLSCGRRTSHSPGSRARGTAT